MAQQARTSAATARLATDSRRQIMLGTQILDTLSEIDRRARSGESAVWEVSQFRRLIQSYGATFSDSGAADFLKRLQSHFDVYADSLAGADPVRGSERSHALVRTYFQDVAKDVNALIELNADSTFQSLHDINSWQDFTSNVALYCLAVFVILSIVASYLLTTIVTRPLSSLIQFLDKVNVEEDLPVELPQLRSNVSEFTRVAKSFEQVLQRLRGYRALNVRRLLIEKRRADIIAASISDGIFLLRGEELLYVNPVGEGILNHNREAATGVDLRTLQQENRCAKAILSAVSQTMPVELEIEQGDRKSYYLIQASPISYDLIEQVEHSVKGPLEQIIDRFQANTIVVAQDVTLVRESQEAKGHFLATLSHEIKTPVTSLTMATRLLSKTIEEIPNPSHRSLVLTCVEDVDRLRRLLEDLLTISRFDAMIQKLEFQNIDLIKLLKNSVQSFQAQAAQRQINLAFQSLGKTPADRGSKSVLVSMDPGKIAWAVSNLLTNALRHTPRGGQVEVKVICSVEEWVEVRVKDSGAGIDPKRQSRIFDKFSPFYDIRVARSGSAGAGLSIAREIVGAHGGRIWVTSEPGHGAEFGFTLPLKRKQGDSAGFSREGQGTSKGPVAENDMKSGSTVDSTVTTKGAASGASACS